MQDEIQPSRVLNCHLASGDRGCGILPQAVSGAARAVGFLDGSICHVTSASPATSTAPAQVFCLRR